MTRNTYYWTCPRCGANLDPGERCDCEKESAAEQAGPLNDGMDYSTSTL